MFAIFDVPVAGAYQLVLALSGVITPALTIVLFTIAVRLLLHPLARAAVRGEKARAALAPQLKKLQAKYGKDRERLGQEIAKLHKESGTSLFAGCLPMLLQIPFFIVMFRLFSTATVAGHPNELLARTLFGAPLGLHWSAAPTDPVFLALFAALAIVAWFSVRITTKAADTPAPALLRLLPYGSIVAATFLPLAAGVYLLTSTAWSTAERAYLRRPRSSTAT